MKALIKFLTALVLAPLAPFFFLYEWVFLKGDENRYVEIIQATPRQRGLITLKRLAIVCFWILAIIVLISIIDTFPDYDIDEPRGENCIPYGDCY